MRNPEFELKVDDDDGIREADNNVAVCNGKKMRIKHYTNRQKILLVGEGDFSFAACLARAFCCASNLTATSLDSRGTVICKYSRGEQNLQTLEEHGATVIHQVDACTMNKHPELKHEVFDRIVFNFPHSGLTSRWEHHSWTIESHQCLVAGFFEAAVQMVDKNGEIHVTHKTADPFDKWGIEKLAENAGFVLKKKKRYHGCEYPGYINKKAYGKRWDSTFPVGKCSTFMFTIEGSRRDAAAYDSDEAELSDATMMALEYYEMADKRKARK